MPRNYKPMHIAPGEGVLDTRATPDEVPYGNFRMLTNIGMTDARRWCRLTGWQKLLSVDSGYENTDLHDQLGYDRQHLTMGYQAISPAGVTRLYVGTQNRIYCVLPELNNWRVI